jgi:hypothetical protein
VEEEDGDESECWKVECLGLSESVMTIATEMINVTEESDALVDNLPPFDSSAVSTSPGAFDAVLDNGIGASGMPKPSRNFDGIGIQQLPPVSRYLPPDTVGDVGPNHYVQMVNRGVAIYSKTGRQIVAPVPINFLFRGDRNCGNGGGDPIVLYDQFDDRWLLTQFTRECREGPNAPPCYNCVAISETSNPTGRYNTYKFVAQRDPLRRWGSVFPDYPKYGIWRDSYVLTTRDFGGDFLYKGASVYAIEKKPMLSGKPTRYSQQILDQRRHGSRIGDGVDMLPADIDGRRLPQPRVPIPIFSSQDNDYGAPFDAINIWELSVDWSSSTSRLVFKQSLRVAEFSSNSKSMP